MLLLDKHHHTERRWWQWELVTITVVLSSTSHTVAVYNGTSSSDRRWFCREAWRHRLRWRWNVRVTTGAKHRHQDDDDDRQGGYDRQQQLLQTAAASAAAAPDESSSPAAERCGVERDDRVVNDAGRGGLTCRVVVVVVFELCASVLLPRWHLTHACTHTETAQPLIVHVKTYQHLARYVDPSRRSSHSISRLEVLARVSGIQNVQNSNDVQRSPTSRVTRYAAAAVGSKCKKDWHDGSWKAVPKSEFTCTVFSAYIMSFISV